MATTVKEVTKDGAIVITGDDGKEVRYVKEDDLLAVKNSREAIEKAKQELEAKDAAALKAANDTAETHRQKVLQAESKVESLTAQVASGAASVAQLAQAKADLEATKKNSGEIEVKYLALRRQSIAASYGVPPATVEKKTLQELDVFEDALKAVVAGGGKFGSFAVGGAGKGGNPLEGKSPTELAAMAYESSNKK
jgi:hypothetical protein